MAETVYALCAITSVICMLMLFRGYHTSGSRLLFWASLCFAGLALNNLLLFVDLILVPDVDLFVWRTGPAVVGMGILIYGLIRDTV